MDAISYAPGDPQLVESIVNEFLSQGKFDRLRKECLADVDTKPAFQNLQQRVESTTISFLHKQTWTPNLVKNQLRDSLRKHILESGFLEAGINRIIDQVVNPKILATLFLPEIEETVYNYLGIPKPTKHEVREHTEQKYIPPLLDLKFDDMQIKPPPVDDPVMTELESISPDSERGTKNRKPDIHVEIPVEVNDANVTEDILPPFERNQSRGSNDSHLSGISELTSHGSHAGGLEENTDETPKQSSFTPKKDYIEEESQKMTEGRNEKMEISSEEEQENSRSKTEAQSSKPVLEESEDETSHNLAIDERSVSIPSDSDDDSIRIKMSPISVRDSSPEIDENLFFDTKIRKESGFSKIPIVERQSSKSSIESPKRQKEDSKSKETPTKKRFDVKRIYSSDSDSSSSKKESSKIQNEDGKSVKSEASRKHKDRSSSKDGGKKDEKTKVSRDTKHDKHSSSGCHKKRDIDRKKDEKREQKSSSKDRSESSNSKDRSESSKSKKDDKKEHKSREEKHSEKDHDKSKSSHDKSRSSSHHKSSHKSDPKEKSHEDDSKRDKERSRDSSRHDKDRSKERKESKGEEKSKSKDKEDEKKKKKNKSVDDHGKERHKNDDRRSTDRDSHERERDRSVSGSRSQSESKKKEKESKSGEYRERKRDKKEQKDAGEDIKEEYFCVDNEKGEMVLKMKKPKIATNFKEIKKIMKMRKEMKKLEVIRREEIQKLIQNDAELEQSCNDNGIVLNKDLVELEGEILVSNEGSILVDSDSLDDMEFVIISDDSEVVVADNVIENVEENTEYIVVESGAEEVNICNVSNGLELVLETAASFTNLNKRSFIERCASGELEKVTFKDSPDWKFPQFGYSTNFEYFEEFEKEKMECEIDFNDYVTELENDSQLRDIEDDDSDDEMYKADEETSRVSFEDLLKNIICSGMQGRSNFKGGLILDVENGDFYRQVKLQDEMEISDLQVDHLTDVQADPVPVEGKLVDVTNKINIDFRNGEETTDSDDDVVKLGATDAESINRVIGVYSVDLVRVDTGSTVEKTQTEKETSVPIEPKPVEEEMEDIIDGIDIMESNLTAVLEKEGRKTPEMCKKDIKTYDSEYLLEDCKENAVTDITNADRINTDRKNDQPKTPKMDINSKILLAQIHSLNRQKLTSKNTESLPQLNQSVSILKRVDYKKNNELANSVGKEANVIKKRGGRKMNVAKTKSLVKADLEVQKEIVLPVPTGNDLNNPNWTDKRVEEPVKSLKRRLFQKPMTGPFLSDDVLDKCEQLKKDKYFNLPPSPDSDDYDAKNNITNGELHTETVGKKMKKVGDECSTSSESIDDQNVSDERVKVVKSKSRSVRRSQSKYDSSDLYKPRVSFSSSSRRRTQPENS